MQKHHPHATLPFKLAMLAVLFGAMGWFFWFLQRYS